MPSGATKPAQVILAELGSEFDVTAGRPAHQHAVQDADDVAGSSSFPISSRIFLLNVLPGKLMVSISIGPTDAEGIAQLELSSRMAARRKRAPRSAGPPLPAGRGALEFTYRPGKVFSARACRYQPQPRSVSPAEHAVGISLPALIPARHLLAVGLGRRQLTGSPGRYTARTRRWSSSVSARLSFCRAGCARVSRRSPQRPTAGGGSLRSERPSAISARTSCSREPGGHAAVDRQFLGELTSSCTRVGPTTEPPRRQDPVERADEACSTSAMRSLRQITTRRSPAEISSIAPLPRCAL